MVHYLTIIYTYYIYIYINIYIYIYILFKVETSFIQNILLSVCLNKTFPFNLEGNTLALNIIKLVIRITNMSYEIQTFCMQKKLHNPLIRKFQ